jgi:hypothetical protein
MPGRWKRRRALFSILTVPRQMILDSQGLRLLAYQDASPGRRCNARTRHRVIPAPTLNWGSYPPLPPPFHAELTASLSIPEAGMYSFAADAGASSGDDDSSTMCSCSILN